MCTEQFHLRNFQLAYQNGKDFAVSPWLSLPAMIGYRLLVALYCLSWVMYSILVDHTWKWFIFLTDCTFLCITAYFICSTAISVHYWCYIHRKVTRQEPSRQQSFDSSSGLLFYNAASRHPASGERDEPLPEGKYYGTFEDSNQDSNSQTVSVALHEHVSEYPQSWNHKVTWLLYSITSNNSILVTVVFWTLLYSGYEVGEPDIAFHLLNSVFMLIETFLSSIPVRLLHVVYAMLYGSLYCLFTVVYWLLGGTNDAGDSYIYPILDYSNDPRLAAILIVLYGFVGLPVAQLIHFGLFKLRCYLTGLRNR
ncbi:uncharacterized protein [Montipora capricornis]|uniref:uncharacterized protein n=1 Tax=Montipora capricornis TaxID=246305 RepID=UPI0035F1F0EF